MPIDRSPRLARLLAPRSVAIVGASDKPGALGATVLANLERNGFDGTIHLINPNRPEIGGRPCLPAIAALPAGVDAAVLAIPRAGVLDAVTALAERGVGATVIFSAGFAEGGEAGLAEQRAIAAVAQAADMVIEGPNCLGAVNHRTGATLTFVETRITPPADDQPGAAIVSQSGAMAAVIGTMLQSRALGLTLSVSTGNEAASGVEDYIEHLAGDAGTRVIAMVVEQFRDPPRFLAAARRARAAGQTIVLLHPGKSSAARASAATHTGAMAGDYAVMRLLVARTGVVFAETLEELVDMVEIAVLCPAPATGGVAVLGESGAFKALMLDLAEELALPLPALGDGDSPRLRAALPDFVGVSNPLDMTAQGLVDPDLYARVLTALLDDDRVGTILIGLIQTDAATIAIKLPPILATMRAAGRAKPVVIAGLDEGAPVAAADVAALRTLGIPYFPSSERALRALARLGRAQRPAPQTLGDAGPVVDLPAAGGTVPEHAAKALLAPLGIAFPRARLARTRDEARAAADMIGYPVALKAQAAALAHKSDSGGVALNLADGAAVERAWRNVAAAVCRHHPGLVLDGMLVEAMAPGGIELIVGARHDPDWGPVVLGGFGGVQAEVLRDVRLFAPDMTHSEIVAELRCLKAAALLDGWRGAAPGDVPAIADLIARLAAMMQANPRIREIDLNPVILRPIGDGLIALDALMMIDPA